MRQPVVSLPIRGKIQLCPSCLGTRIDLYLGGYVGKIYRCLDCNYVGPVVIETTCENYVSFMKQNDNQGATDGCREN